MSSASDHDSVRRNSDRPTFQSPQKRQCDTRAVIQTLEMWSVCCGRGACRDQGMCEPKRFVYILKSLAKPDTYYVGITSDVASRLESHNAGLTRSTCRDRPWRKLVVIEFDEQQPACAFERYLKTGSGREFSRRHFRQTSKR